MITAGLLEVVLDDLPNGVSVSLAHELENDVLRFKYGARTATVGCGFTTEKGRQKPWATVYRLDIDSDLQEDAKFLLSTLKKYYKKHGYDFGFSFATTAALKGVLYKLGIQERMRGGGS